MGYLIAKNIRDLVSEQRAARIEAEVLRKRMEGKGEDMFLGAVYGDLMNISRISYLTVWAIPLWPALTQAPKYREALRATGPYGLDGVCT